jgi:hypothetical protein
VPDAAQEGSRWARHRMLVDDVRAGGCCGAAQSQVRHGRKEGFGTKSRTAAGDGADQIR